MQGGLGSRFALEAVFLIALAIGTGVAQLSATAIVVVMAVAWLLVCLFELAAWAEGPRFPTFRRERVMIEEPAVAAEPAVDEPEPESESEPDPVPLAATADTPRDGEGR
ncbi:MAG: hypothetical protein H0V79_05765 [Actinobacteria bacterium]|nr:hypothetical protein [Actinomycetota bacterium]